MKKNIGKYRKMEEVITTAENYSNSDDDDEEAENNNINSVNNVLFSEADQTDLETTLPGMPLPCGG